MWDGVLGGAGEILKRLRLWLIGIVRVAVRLELAAVLERPTVTPGNGHPVTSPPPKSKVQTITPAPTPSFEYWQAQAIQEAEEPRDEEAG